MAKTVLLTGISGFVGSHVLRHILVNTDWDVVGIASFAHRGSTARLNRQMDGVDKSRVKIVLHDLVNPITEKVADEIGKVDYVLNLASESHVDRSITSPRPFVENNVQLILTMLEYIRKYPVKKFIQISTDEVYGPIKSGGHKEGEAHRPSNPYSGSKAAQESICFSYWRTYKLPVVITNTMNIIGEMQDAEKFVPKVMRALEKGEKVPVHASPEGVPGSRFYLHARNQADALLFLLKNHEPAIYPAEDMDRFNVVGDVELDNLTLGRKIADYMGRELRYELQDFHSSRPGHDLRYGLDGTKMAELGWRAPIPFEASLRRVVEWTKEHPEWLE